MGLGEIDMVGGGWIKGSHNIFAQEGIADIVNLQPDGSKVKRYQVKQVRQLIDKYKLAGRLYEED
jgi:hypothetical protein